MSEVGFICSALYRKLQNSNSKLFAAQEDEITCSVSKIQNNKNNNSHVKLFYNTMIKGNVGSEPVVKANVLNKKINKGIVDNIKDIDRVYLSNTICR